MRKMEGSASVVLHDEEGLRDSPKQESKEGMMSAASSPEGEEWWRRHNGRLCLRLSDGGTRRPSSYARVRWIGLPVVEKQLVMVVRWTLGQALNRGHDGGGQGNSAWSGWLEVVGHALVVYHLHGQGSHS
jgi:hypothetical protein